jgi:hypothetical protein
MSTTSRTSTRAGIHGAGLIARCFAIAATPGSLVGLRPPEKPEATQRNVMAKWLHSDVVVKRWVLLLLLAVIVANAISGSDWLTLAAVGVGLLIGLILDYGQGYRAPRKTG